MVRFDKLVGVPANIQPFHTAPPFTFSQTARVELIQAIIQDLRNVNSKGKLTSKGIIVSITKVFRCLIQSQMPHRLCYP